MSKLKISSKGLKFYAPLTDKYLQSPTLASDISAYHNHAISVTGTPTYDAGGVETDNSTKTVSFPCDGVFNSFYITIATRFTPYFNWNETGNVNAHIFSTIRGAGPTYPEWYRMGKDRSGLGDDLFFTLAGQNFEVLDEVYSQYWLKNQENTLILVGDSIADHAYVWFNGVLIYDNTVGWAASGNAQTMVLGAFLDSAPEWNGKIRDFMVFDRMWTEDERLAFESGSQGLYTPSTISSLDKGLVFDMPCTSDWLQSSTTVSDKTPYRNDFTAYGSPSFSSDGASFSNTTDYLWKDNIAFRSSDQQGSVSVWFKTDSVKTHCIFLMSIDIGSINNYMQIILHSGVNNYAFCICHRNAANNAYYATNTNGLNDGQWHHGVVTCDGIEWKLYIDSVDDGGFVLDDPFGGNVGRWFADVVSADNIGVGAAYRSSGIVTSAMDFEVAQIKVWNRVLSDAEIKTLYNRGRHRGLNKPYELSKDLVLDVKCASDWLQSSEVISDRTAYRNHFTLVNSPTVSSTGITFNGSTQRAIYDDASGFRPNDQQGTVSYWITPTSNNGNISFGIGKTGFASRFVDFNMVNGKIRFVKYDEVTGDRIMDSDDVLIYANILIHIVVTSNGSRYLMYSDGQLREHSMTVGVDDGGWFGDLTSSDTITIGGLRRNTLNYYFSGTIHEVKVWSRELSAEEVLQLYKQGI